MNAKVDVTHVVLETDRLILRAWQWKDLDDFFEYARVDGVGERAGWSHHESKSESMAILKRFIEGKKTFAIVLKENQKTIGSLGLENLRQYTGDEFNNLVGREIGYVLSKDYWNRGLMSEAVQCVIDWCFQEENYDFLMCCNFIENAASAKVQKKCGFEPYKRVEYSSSFGLKTSQVNVLRRR
jgi:ribosomal-protein-alanine N-acetyltransferase